MLKSLMSASALCSLHREKKLKGIIEEQNFFSKNVNEKRKMTCC